MIPHWNFFGELSLMLLCVSFPILFLFILVRPSHNDQYRVLNLLVFFWSLLVFSLPVNIASQAGREEFWWWWGNSCCGEHLRQHLPAGLEVRLLFIILASLDCNPNHGDFDFDRYIAFLNYSSNNEHTFFLRLALGAFVPQCTVHTCRSDLCCYTYFLSPVLPWTA